MARHLHPRETYETWWESYESRLDREWEFYSMPVVCLICCCGCGIPCQDMWNFSLDLPQYIVHWYRRKTKSDKDRKSHRDLIARLKTPISSSTFPQPTQYELQHSCLFKLPKHVRLRIWEYCIGQRFIYAPIHDSNSNGHNIVARRVAYPDAYRLATEKNLYLDSGNAPDTVTYSWRPLEMILLPYMPYAIAEPHMSEPKQSVAFGNVGIFLTKGSQKSTPGTKIDTWKSTELLLSCKAIYAEANHLLFTNNAFSFTHATHLSAFRLDLGFRWQYLRFLHLDLILGPPVYLPGVIDRDTWRELWIMISRDLLLGKSDPRASPYQKGGLQVLDVDIHVPMSYTVGRWLAYRGKGWRARAEFFQGLQDWAQDLAVLRGLRHARFGIDPERSVESPPYTSWPFGLDTLRFRDEVANEVPKMMSSHL